MQLLDNEDAMDDDEDEDFVPSQDEPDEDEFEEEISPQKKLSIKSKNGSKSSKSKRSKQEKIIDDGDFDSFRERLRFELFFFLCCVLLCCVVFCCVVLCCVVLCFVVLCCVVLCCVLLCCVVLCCVLNHLNIYIYIIFFVRKHQLKEKLKAEIKRGESLKSDYDIQFSNDEDDEDEDADIKEVTIQDDFTLPKKTWKKLYR